MSYSKTARRRVILRPGHPVALRRLHRHGRPGPAALSAVRGRRYAGDTTGSGVFYHFPYFGHSNYNALQVVATRRLSKGLGFLVSYAFQKTLTNTDSASVYYGGTPRTSTTGGWRNRSLASTTPSNCV